MVFVIFAPFRDLRDPNALGMVGFEAYLVPVAVGAASGLCATIHWYHFLYGQNIE